MNRRATPPVWGTGVGPTSRRGASIELMSERPLSERPLSERPLSRIPFDPREERVVLGLARWMGLLGRFQIVAATFIFVVLLAVTGIVTTAEVLEPAANAAGQVPLVSIGEVPRGTVAIVVAIVVAFSLLFLRGGMLLIAGAEDLESVHAKEALDQDHLDSALGRLRTYFVLESLFMVVIAGATYAATIAGWGS